TASYTWTVDTVAPSISITNAPNNPAGTAYAPFAFTTSEGTTACSLDGAAFTACTSPLSYSLADGNHSCKFVATDAAGNSTTSSTFSWLIDTKPPVISGAHYDCDYLTGALNVYWSASDAGVGIASGTCSYPSSAYPFNCTNIRALSRSLQQTNGLG